MTLAQLFHAPPAELFLCSDCGQVGNSPASCPGCASEHGLLNLANVLNRDPNHDAFARLMESKPFQDSFAKTLAEFEAKGYIRRFHARKEETGTSRSVKP